MLGREKMNGSEMRALWGSRIVIWITIILVLFPVVWIVMSSFSAGDSFFLSSLTNVNVPTIIKISTLNVADNSYRLDHVVIL